MACHIICFVSFRFVSFRFVSFRFDLFRFVLICFVSFRFVSFRFDLFRFVPFRFCFVSHFTGTRHFFFICHYIFMQVTLSGREICPLSKHPSIFLIFNIRTKIRPQVRS